MSERIVMVGAGYWAQFQVEGWRDAGAPLAAICNRHLDAAQALAQRYGVPRCYDDLARIEVPVGDLAAVLDRRPEVAAAVQAAGYRYVTLDLEGLRSGNLNGALDLGDQAP